jgi:histidinol phosphatase-like enzyme
MTKITPKTRNWMPPPRKQLNWIGVDFDDTIVKNTGFPDFEPTEIIDGAKEALDELVKNGYKLVIFTARSWSDHELVEDFLKDNGIKFKSVICGKPLFHRMIDDRNIEFNGDWKLVVNKLL